MSTTMVKTRQRPEVSLRDAVGQQAAPEEHKVTKHTLSITTKATDDVEQDALSDDMPIFRPTDEQVELINRFTMSPKTADELAVFPAHACNTLWDRDDDRFVEETIKGFGSIAPPYSPIGKGFLIGHNHHSLPVGKIFDQSVEKFDIGTGKEELYLRTWQYMPKTPQYMSFLENLDFGVYQHVSVGVMLNEAKCSVCANEWSWNPWFCVAGHEKGFHYDPDNDEEDKWGYPVPVEDGEGDADKAVFCGREFIGARDFYELSQVYLGAQYFAEVTDKVPALKSIGEQPGSLTAAEIKQLHPMDDKLDAALKAGAQIGLTPDGNVSWKDEEGFVWFYDVSEGKYATLGRSDSDWASSVVLLDSGDQFATDGPTEDKIVPSGTDETENEIVPKAQLIEAAQKSNLPSEVLETIAAVDDDSEALTVLCSSMAEQLTKATNERDEARNELATAKELADLGTAYVKQLREDVIDAYVKANLDPNDEKPVVTDTIEKLVEACGDNVSLLKALHDDYSSRAAGRFPAVRSSVTPTDPHQQQGTNKESKDSGPVPSVSRLHG